MGRHNNALECPWSHSRDEDNLHEKNNFAERFKILAEYRLKKKNNFVLSK